jgi:hypothetical protein
MVSLERGLTIKVITSRSCPLAPEVIQNFWAWYKPDTDTDPDPDGDPTENNKALSSVLRLVKTSASPFPQSSELGI